MIVVSILVVIIFIVLPFVPSILELRRMKDADPLPIDGEKTVSPFETGDRFQQWVKKLESAEDLDRVQAFGNVVELVEDGKAIVALSDGDVFIPSRHVLGLRTLVKGQAAIGAHAFVQSMFVSGNAVIGPAAVFGNWIDCRGDTLNVADGADLGHSCVCMGVMNINGAVCFERLFGKSIFFSGKMQHYSFEYHLIKGNLITSKKIVVQSGEKVEGDISGKKDVILQENSVVCGSIFSDGNVIVNPNCIVFGNIFSQGDVSIGCNSSIGTEGKIKSIVSGGNIRIGNHVEVYGHILCSKGKTEKEQEHA